MSDQPNIISKTDCVIAVTTTGGCTWLIGALFSWSWSIWAYAGVAGFFFLVSIGHIANIKNQHRANNAAIEMNERQKPDEADPWPEHAPWEVQEDDSASSTPSPLGSRKRQRDRRPSPKKWTK